MALLHRRRHSACTEAIGGQSPPSPREVTNSRLRGFVRRRAKLGRLGRRMQAAPGLMVDHSRSLDFCSGSFSPVALRRRNAPSTAGCWSKGEHHGGQSAARDPRLTHRKCSNACRKSSITSGHHQSRRAAAQGHVRDGSGDTGRSQKAFGDYEQKKRTSLEGKGLKACIVLGRRPSSKRLARHSRRWVFTAGEN